MIHNEWKYESLCVKYIEKYLALIDSKCQEMQQTRPDLSSDKSGYIQI